MKNMPDTFSIDFACLQISPFETVTLYSFWIFPEIKSPNKNKHAQLKHFLNRSAKHACLLHHGLKRLNLPIKSQAPVPTGRLFCIGVSLNFNSFGRNSVTTFRWPGCFKSMLAYLIHPQNTKNP